MKKARKFDPDELAAQVTVLSEIVRFAPDSFEEKSDAVVSFLLETLKVPTLDSEVSNPIKGPQTTC